MPSTSFTSSDGNAFEWLTLSRSCERSGRDAAVRSARRAGARGGSHGHVVGTLQRARATRKHHLLRQRRREGAQHHATSTATRREVRHVSLHRSPKPLRYIDQLRSAGDRVAGANFPACKPISTRAGIQVLQSMNVMDQQARSPDCIGDPTDAASKISS